MLVTFCIALYVAIFTGIVVFHPKLSCTVVQIHAFGISIAVIAGITIYKMPIFIMGLLGSMGMLK